MSRFPREPLDAEERALAAALPRLHGRDEPDAALDARILSAAHAAVQVSPRPARRRRSWIAPVGVAASLCLATTVKPWRSAIRSQTRNWSSSDCSRCESVLYLAYMAAFISSFPCASRAVSSHETSARAQ